MPFKTLAQICTTLALVPTLALAAPGLLAKYSDGPNTIETTVPTLAFSLRESDSIHPQLAPRFTAEFTGTLKILRRATYTFTADGATIEIDGKSVTAPIELANGDHALTLRYTRKPGPARFQPTWSSDAFGPEPLPLSALSHDPVSDAALQQSLVDRGRLLFEELNCAACHDAGRQKLATRPGPDLTNVGARNLPVAFMRLTARSPKMPAILANEADSEDVAAYLATLKDPKRKAPDLKRSEEKAKQGEELFNTIGCANCHPPHTLIAMKWQSIGQLAAYLKDPLSVDRSGRMPSMNLTDEEAASLAQYLFQNSARIESPGPGLGDAKRGQHLVRTAGCLNCHTIDGDAGKPLLDARTFPSLDKLDPAKGCLAATPPATAARYEFRADTREAIAAFVTSVKSVPLISSAPTHEWQQSLRKFNCIACHETEFTKPAEGQEIVPPLTNIGAKLKPDWIRQVLSDKRARVRFWLKTRMPDFGPEVHRLAEQAVAASGSDTTPEPRLIPSTASVAQGQHLVGANDAKQNPTGMGCVTCHSLREFKPSVAADATRGPELTMMSTRLRADFFRRWLHDPARIQSGTAMPNFFTDKSREEADGTIDTLWSYASLGVAMPPPIGIKEKRNTILIVTDTPIVQRGQIPDPNGLIVYGVSVGVPGMINYTFDAQHCLLRTAWQGGFLDMAGDWNDRGGNPVKILGQCFLTQAAPNLRVGTPDADVPRTFQGYELKDKIPTFLYKVGDAEIRERITALPESQGPGLIRTFEITNTHSQPLYFTAPDDPTLTLTSPAGPFKPAKVQKSFKSDDKSPGQILALPAGEKFTFSVTIRAK